MIVSCALSQSHNARGKTLTNFKGCAFTVMALAMVASVNSSLRGKALTEIHMSNSDRAIQFTDRNSNATAKQIYFIGRHFAQLEADTPKEVYGLSKIYPAVMLKWNAEHSETPITMGDIDTWKAGEKVPTKFTKMITAKKPTAKAKATPKPKATPVKTKATPKPSEMSAGDFKDHFEKITGRVSQLEETSKEHTKRMATMDAKLDIIMAHITEAPDGE